MKKIINTLLFLALGGLSAMAGNNKLKIADFFIAPGEEKELAVELDNEDNISSLQFDVKLPVGLNLVDKSLARVVDRITRTSHSVLVAEQEDGDQRFGILSTSSEVKNSGIKGNSGAILTFKVKAGNNFRGGELSFNECVGSNATVEGQSPVELEIEADNTKALLDVGELSAENESMIVRANEENVLNVSLNNNIKLVALQATVTLPEGVSFVMGDEGYPKVAYGDRLSDNVEILVKAVPGKANVYTLVLSSVTSDVIEGNEGNLFGLSLVADPTFKEGDVKIEKIIVSNAAGYRYDMEEGTECHIKCVDDPTGDGVWDVKDYNEVAAVILGLKENSACDLNGDGVVNVVDYNAAAEKILNSK